MNERIMRETFKDTYCPWWDHEEVALKRANSSPLSFYTIKLINSCECGSHNAWHDEVRDEIVCSICGVVLCEQGFNQCKFSEGAR